LTPKEYDLLAFFVSRPGVAFTRDMLLNHVWGYDFYGDARTVDTHVKSLRDKLGKYREWIVTVWGTGYRFTGGKS
jgi:two-component system response regulator ResD